MANIRMVACPQCGTIQKAGTTCSICKLPIPWELEEVKRLREHIKQDKQQKNNRIDGEDF